MAKIHRISRVLVLPVPSNELYLLKHRLQVAISQQSPSASGSAAATGNRRMQVGSFPALADGRRGPQWGRLLSMLWLSMVAAQLKDAPSRLRASSSRSFEDFGRILQDGQNCTESCCQQYITECPVGESNAFAGIPFGVQIFLIVLLLLLTAAFAGLTLGFLGLDKTGLEIIMDSDDEVSAARARRIYPLRKRGNLLLCSLVLGNVGANSLLSILMADKAGGLIGFISSTLLIVIFGEIIPQALCTRYALAIGSAAVPLVKVVLVLLFPVAYPLSWVLDKALGQEIATTYSSSELMKLLQIHVTENALDAETAVAMTGALKYKNLSVRNVMTPVDKMFMLSVDDKLNWETMAKIFKTGFSRIPIYAVNKNNVIGLLFVKDLIFIDPEDATRVADVIDIFGRSLHVAWIDDKLGDVLRELKKGRSHMALVRDVNTEDETKDPYYELKGIITLEDIIEEILGDEIVDETDAPVSAKSGEEDREETFRWARLRLLDSKIVDQNLSFDEARAVTAHLWHNFPEVVSLLTEHQLHLLIAETPVVVLPTAVQDIGQPLPNELLYEKDVPVDFATLVLTGKVTVVTGADCFRTDVSNWAFLGRYVLLNPSYAPDFSAFVSSGPSRCIFISRARFSAAVDASALERRKENQNGEVTRPVSQQHIFPLPVTSEQHSRENGKHQKLLAALHVIDRSDRIEPSPPNIDIAAESTTDVAPPSLLDQITVPTVESKSTQGT